MTQGPKGTNLENIPTNNVAENKDSNISAEELAMLDAAGKYEEEQLLKKATLDGKDEEGVPLNEKAEALALDGSDLDVPGSEEDDSNEAIGEEDEENNSYSLGGDKHD